MKLEILLQFIVPLTFLAIWALTSLLNRETQPLPQRPTRPGERPITSAGGVPAGPMGREAPAGPLDRRSANPSESSDAIMKGLREGRSAAELEDAGVYITNEEVVFVDPTTNRRIASAPLNDAAAVASAARIAGRAPRSASSRKSARGRRNASPLRESVREPETRRALTDQVSRSMLLSRSRPLDIVPLSTAMTPLSPLTKPPSSETSRARMGSRPALQARDIRDMLASPRKLREVALLSEVLQPPVTLRPRSTGL